MTYSSALRLEQTPKTMIVLGGGYVAAELGHFFSMSGTNITFLVRSHMLNSEDEEIRNVFQKQFINEPRRRVFFQEQAIRVTHTNNQFTVITKHKDGRQSTHTAEALLIATGVTPNVLDACQTGVDLSASGFIKVNDSFQTNVNGIYAFGDVIGRHLYRHTANYEGEWLFNAVFRQPELLTKGIQYPPIPHAVFTNPQIAGVGFTESQACLEYGQSNILVGKCNYEDVAMGFAMAAPESCFCKLVFDTNSLRLIGAHIIGPEASNMIHMLIAFMKFKATFLDIFDTIYVHPALPEVIRDACRNAKSKLQCFS